MKSISENIYIPVLKCVRDIVYLKIPNSKHSSLQYRHHQRGNRAEMVCATDLYITVYDPSRLSDKESSY